VVEIAGGVTLGVSVGGGVVGVTIGGGGVAVCADCAVVIYSNKAVIVRSGVGNESVDGATLAGMLQAVASSMIANRTTAIFLI
jgi:hypothetical protein